jgi:hypothetical protein
MDRHISAIVRKFSVLLGVKSWKKSGIGMAVPGSDLISQLRSLGLRHGGGSSWAGSRVALARVSTARRRPAGMARNDSIR